MALLRMLTGANFGSSFSRATSKATDSAIRKQLRAAAKDMRTVQGMADANFSKLQSAVERQKKKIEKSTDKDEIKLHEEKLSACLRMISEHAAPLLSN